MLTMSTLHKEVGLLERILQECEDDYVGLWSIYRQVKEAGYSDPSLCTMALLHFLLSAGVLEAGIADDQGNFHPWSTSSGDAYLRIVGEWSRLGREPDVGDIVWFTTPVPTKW